MKKFLAVLLVVTLAITGVFALDMSIGAELGFGQHLNFYKVADIKITETENVIPVKVDFMLGMDDLPLAFRFDFGTDVFKLSGMKSGDEKVPKDAVDEMSKATPSLAVSAAAYYKYDVNKKFSVMAGLGFGYDFLNMAKYSKQEIGDLPDGYSCSINRHMLSMYIDTEVRYEVVDHVELFGGVKFGGNVMDKVVSTIKGPNFKEVEKDDMADMMPNSKYSNIIWGLSVGAAYKF